MTVVVPCFNAAACVGEAIQSVARQTRLPHEVVIVDDASTDGTEAVISALAAASWPFRLQSIRLQANVGAGEARNTGCAVADPGSRYIAFLDADDIWKPRKIEHQIGWMEGNPGVQWTAHPCGIRGEAASDHVIEASPSPRPLSLRSLLFRNSVATASVIARRPAGAWFRPGWRYCEDLMLWLAWLDEQRLGVMLGEVLAMLGRRPMKRGGLTGNRAAMYHGEVRVLLELRRCGRLTDIEWAGWRGYAALRYFRRALR